MESESEFEVVTQLTVIWENGHLHICSIWLEYEHSTALWSQAKSSACLVGRNLGVWFFQLTAAVQCAIRVSRFVIRPGQPGRARQENGYLTEWRLTRLLVLGENSTYTVLTTHGIHCVLKIRLGDNLITSYRRAMIIPIHISITIVQIWFQQAGSEGEVTSAPQWRHITRVPTKNFIIFMYIYELGEKKWINGEMCSKTSTSTRLKSY